MAGVIVLADLSREDADDIEVIQPTQQGFSGQVLSCFRFINPVGSGKIAEVRQIKVYANIAVRASLTEGIAGGLGAPDQVGSPHWRHQGVNAPTRAAMQFQAQYGTLGAIGGIVDLTNVPAGGIVHLIAGEVAPWYIVPGGALGISCTHSTAVLDCACIISWNERRLRSG